MTDMEIYNMLYEHRKNVCRLMVNETMTQLKRDRLNGYIEQLQHRLKVMSKRLTIRVEFIEPEEVEKDPDMTVADYFELMERS